MKKIQSLICVKVAHKQPVLCGEAFTEENPAVSLAVTMDLKNCPRYFCGVCNELI